MTPPDQRLDEVGCFNGDMNKPSASTIWPVVHHERRALAHDLEAIDPAQWGMASLCPGWDIHDVLAHLIDSATTTRLAFIRRMVAARFDFDRDNAAGISRERASNPLATLAAFRKVSASEATPPAPLATRLVEAFVHGEDIRRPLGIARAYPPDDVAIALTYQLNTSVKMGGGRERAKGRRLVTTDASFTHGDGLEARGTALALLLAVSGRPLAPGELTGPGASHEDFAVGT